MPRWYEPFRRVPTAAGWKPQASGFHVASEYSARIGGSLIYWLEGDLSGAVKRISKPFQISAGTTISIAWAFLFKLDAATANDYVTMWLFANQETIDNAIAGFNAYSVSFIGHGSCPLSRFPGGGGAGTIIFDPNWAADTNEHLCVISREVSGANRFWRMYLDPPIDNLFDATALVAGPTNDATYTVAEWIGIEHSLTNRQRTAAVVMQW